jgi:hypothetical protein
VRCAGEEASGFLGVLGVLGFGLAGEEAGFVVGAEDVIQDGFDVGGLVALLGEQAGADGVWVDDLEVEGGGAFFAFGQGFSDEGGVRQCAVGCGSVAEEDFVGQGMLQ